jgi:hypothetical protein
MARIRQILLNLLNTTVKYAREGYIRLTVYGEAAAEVQKDKRKVKLVFRVEDTGVGECVLNFIKENSLKTIMVLLAKPEEMVLCKHTLKL